MQTRWCWRCRAEVPMMHDSEWIDTYPLFIAALKADKLRTDPEEVLHKYQTLSEAMATLFGSFTSDPRVPFWHKHLLSSLGPPCSRCNKVLRTPLASKCFECSFARSIP